MSIYRVMARAGSSYVRVATARNNGTIRVVIFRRLLTRVSAMLRLGGTPPVRLGVTVLIRESVEELTLVTARIVDLDFRLARVSRKVVIVRANILLNVSSVIIVVVVGRRVGVTVMRLGRVLIRVSSTRVLTRVVSRGLACTVPMRLVNCGLPMIPVPRNLVMSVSRNSMLVSINVTDDLWLPCTCVLLLAILVHA